MAAFIVEHDSPLSAWGQVHRNLRHRIDSGEFAAGDRIPTELELSTDYAVSRVTIRRSIRALIDEGYLRSRRGSGTYVTDSTVALVCELDLARPWKEQLLIDGHDARSQSVPSAHDLPLPTAVAHAFGWRIPLMQLHSSVTLHTVDGVPIGVTEAWRSELWDETALSANRRDNPAPLVAECFAEVGFATTFQAQLLQSHLDIPLIVVIARTHFELSGDIAEYARTSWLGSRVKLAYTRQLRASQMDVAEHDK
ncbi:GntR family transcriptional regulator [Cryobacterium glaciale]|uniref:GntR family transcriptional regulator n=1 Tax=Cryobacterium glaciale TaxID=1259145 RepID=A0A4R8UV48_9MICO|nr:GntR family transcriptional regulator [Cryobacterium glaciale]TFB71191.1 GntR family transcriptional regulator [Cryobacterium glaciale]